MPKPRKHADAIDQMFRSFLKSERPVRVDKVNEKSEAPTAMHTESITKKTS